jgi:hypothetical protein
VGTGNYRRIIRSTRRRGQRKKKQAQGKGGERNRRPTGTRDGGRKGAYWHKGKDGP